MKQQIYKRKKTGRLKKKFKFRFPSLSFSKFNFLKKKRINTPFKESFLSDSSRVRWQKVLVFLSIFLLVQIVLEIVFFPLLNIRFIHIEGLNKVSQEDILSVAGIKGKEYYFSLDERLIEKELEAFSWVKRSKIEKIFPNTLKIKIEEREPIFLHVSNHLREKGSTPFLIDEEGVIFIEGREALSYDLPLLSGITFQEVGIKSQFPLFLRRIFQDMGELKRNNKFLFDFISEVEVKSKWAGESFEIYLYLREIPIIFLLSSRLSEEKILEAILVLDVLKKEGKINLVKEVDLRGREAVYQYERE